MTLLVFTCSTMNFAAAANCYEQAAQHYKLPVELIRAVASVESGGLNPDVVSKNSNGTKDIGRMQINTSWLKHLKAHRIEEADLLDECKNILVGTWILAQNVSQMGLNWEAVGAYNVGCSKLGAEHCRKLRNRYAWKVFSAISKRSDRQSDCSEVADCPARNSALQSRNSFAVVTFQ